MTVHVGKVTFSDWVSLPFKGKWTDTFIFRIDARNCLPPFVFRSMLQRMCAYVCTKHSTASLWIQVDAPGEWYLAEVKRSMLPGLGLPYVVTSVGDVPKYTFCVAAGVLPIIPFIRSNNEFFGFVFIACAFYWLFASIINWIERK